MHKYSKNYLIMNLNHLIKALYKQSKYTSLKTLSECANVPERTAKSYISENKESPQGKLLKHLTLDIEVEDLLEALEIVKRGKVQDQFL